MGYGRSLLCGLPIRMHADIAHDDTGSIIKSFFNILNRMEYTRSWGVLGSPIVRKKERSGLAAHSVDIEHDTLHDKADIDECRYACQSIV